MNELINDEAVYRTAPATPGLLTRGFRDEEHNFSTTKKQTRNTGEKNWKKQGVKHYKKKQEKNKNYKKYRNKTRFWQDKILARKDFRKTRFPRHPVFFQKTSAAPFGNKSPQLRGAWVCSWADLQNLQGGAAPPHQTETRWTEKEMLLHLAVALVKAPLRTIHGEK